MRLALIAVLALAAGMARSDEPKKPADPVVALIDKLVEVDWQDTKGDKDADV